MQHFPGVQPARKAIKLVTMLGLFVIAIATVVAGVIEVNKMIVARDVTLADLLLLFLYLEILAMVAIYLESGKLPVRFPLYIAIIALARYLIIDMKEMGPWEAVSIGVTILIITLAVMVIRYGHIKFPYESSSGSFDTDFSDQNNNKKDLGKK